MISEGVSFPGSSMKSAIVERMIADGVIKRTQIGRTQSALSINDYDALNKYLFNQFGISDLSEYIARLGTDEFTRADLVGISSNSKLRKVRTFKGFLVNSYQDIECTLNDSPLVINPSIGSFVFVADFERFIPDPSVTVVGIENPENFRFIAAQRYLFEGLNPLFVCRYPYSTDLINWLKLISNNYLHFGDLDFAGINIFINEYYRVLGDKARFLIPENSEQLLQRHGNRELYARQAHLASGLKVNDARLTALIELFHKYKKVLEQEVFIT